MRAEFSLATDNDSQVNVSLFEIEGTPMINLRINCSEIRQSMKGIALTQKEAMILASILNDFGYGRYFEKDVISKENKPD